MSKDNEVAREKFEKAKDVAWEEYHKSWTKYHKAIHTAWEEHEKAKASKDGAS